MTLVLGISAFFHDSAVALLRDGQVVAAASEERFSRRKHDARFPKLALRACLDKIGAQIEDIDYVAYYEKPLLKFDRLLETYLAFAPRGYRSFAHAMPPWLHTKLRLPHVIRQNMQGWRRRRLIFCEHHEAHAASAFFPSPFDEAAVLTIDGVGEWATTTWGVGCGNRLELRQEVRFPHSLGLFYSAFTYFCGFRVNSGEYKLMGLAPYGRPVYADLIRDHLIDIHEDGSFHLHLEYFPYCTSLRMTGKKLERLLGCRRRVPETPIRQVDMDLAASVQSVTEEIVLKLAQHVHRQTGQAHLCMAGGVALNCVANGRLLREGPFRRIWVQPAAGDAGGAVGAAWLVWHQLLQQRRCPLSQDGQSGSLLGPEVQDHEIALLLRRGAKATCFAEPAELDRIVAVLLDRQAVVGWVQGAMEFGPRALGNRSILGDPRHPEMQSKMNLKIKFRESFRPFAPAVLQEHASEYFDMRDDDESPYMLFTFYVREGHRCAPAGDLPGLERVKQVRSDIPAVTHLDYSARVQTVSPTHHPRFYRLLDAFYQRTGCPVLINTSFNVRGEPIVCTAEDAYRCFLATDMDALVINNYLFLKEDQPAELVRREGAYVKNLELD
ncbi:MAG: hypothetical protein KatS3mg111_2615 [Pirellulaceae bacterium]|nr:MAG: hypothetical protein KatS3mg111_2615 [Pirellulaceae bacterium]